ncbi:hypothetical protein BDR05DRAFT_966341 [Suillus weaverae]|nr:hypothetical protein BDR05DRAFT_966341 [Suillus weaverae]
MRLHGLKAWSVPPVLLPTMVNSVGSPPNCYPRGPIIPEVALPRLSSCRSGGIAIKLMMNYESWTKQHIPNIMAVRRPMIYENKM